MPSRNSKKKKGKGGRKGKGCGGKSRTADAQKQEGQAKELNANTDEAGNQNEESDLKPTGAISDIDAKNEWQPGGRKMSRRVEADKQLHLSAVTRSIPKMGCQSLLPRFPLKEDFIELSNGARLAIYSPDGSAVAKDEMISNPIHCRVMYHASVLADENFGRVRQTYLELLDSSKDSDRRSTEILKRIGTARALLTDLSSKAKILSEEYDRANASFVPVLLHVYATGIVGVLSGDYHDLDDSEATIDYGTEAMAWCLPYYGLHGASFLTTTCECLFRRGIAFYELGRYDEALLDLRGACAAGRLPVHGVSNSGDLGVNHTQNTQWYLATLAKQKLEDNMLQRPMFSGRERKKIEKELGLGMYSKARYVCRGCGAEPSDNVPLRRCGKCKNAWFCSKACLKQNWHSESGGHRGDCNSEYEEEIFSKELQPFTNTVGEGYALSKINDYGPVAMVRDYDKAEFFSALTDHTLTFAD